MKKRKIILFTLLELLTVVAVVMILLSILLPGIKRARENAKLISCANNMRQIGIGMTAYAGDNSGMGYVSEYGTAFASLWLEGARRLSYNSWPKYDMALKLIEPGYITAHMLECPAISNVREITPASAGTLWFATEFYGKASSGHVVAPSYLVKPTGFRQGFYYHRDVSRGYRFGMYPGCALGYDFSFLSNKFNHQGMSNVLYEDGVVLKFQLEKNANLQYFSYPVWPHEEIMMHVLAKVSRPIGGSNGWGTSWGEWCK